MKNRALQKLLCKRQFDVTKLAAQIFTGRCHLVQVLRGQRVGRRTWAKLEEVLKPEEYKVAKEYADTERAAREKEGKTVGTFPVSPELKTGGGIMRPSDHT